mmetsp:Transcript_42944/g.48670  ORF Transcript_42944/g.48670 Transcript_42944/m.48670 type:complete len:82 (+) Transcript_42944:455-700(+)
MWILSLLLLIFLSVVVDDDGKTMYTVPVGRYSTKYCTNAFGCPFLHRPIVSVFNNALHNLQSSKFERRSIHYSSFSLSASL